MSIHMPYKLRCLGLASAQSVWSNELFLEFCAELQVNPEDVKSTKTSGYTIPELQKMGLRIGKSKTEMLMEAIPEES